MVETLLTIVMLGVCLAALVVSLIDKKKVGCERPNCCKKYNNE